MKLAFGDDGALLNASEQLALKRLQVLAENWPKTLWLFAADGELHVMRKIDGEHKTLPNGGVDPAHIVATIDIEADGGDW